MNQLQFQVSMGTIAVTWNSSGALCRLDWYDNCSFNSSIDSWSSLSVWSVPPELSKFLARLRNYFESGEPLGQIPWGSLDQTNWSEFQRKVYQVTATIPHGETRTYAWVARRIGNPAAVRAVGQALRKNLLPIIIPCHRVVATDCLGGFMGSTDVLQPELQLKQKLISLEETYLSPVFDFAKQSWGRLSAFSA